MEKDAEEVEGLEREGGETEAFSSTTNNNENNNSNEEIEEQKEEEPHKGTNNVRFGEGTTVKLGQQRGDDVDIYYERHGHGETKVLLIMGN